MVVDSKHRALNTADLIKLLMNRGWTISAIAEHPSISKTRVAVSRWANGHTDPTWANRAALIDLISEPPPPDYRRIQREARAADVEEIIGKMFKRGWGNNALARRIGVAPTVMSDWVRGKTAPDAATVEQLRRVADEAPPRRRHEVVLSVMGQHTTDSIYGGSLADLARLTGYHYSSVSKSLKKLIEMGAITRLEPLADGEPYRYHVRVKPL